MFRKNKKQTPDNGRNVRSSSPAPVFSYYSNRSQVEGADLRRGESVALANRKKLDKGKWLTYMPSVLAGLALVTCMVYISTLSSSPKLQFLGDQRASLLSQKDSYEKDVEAVFNESIYNRSKLLIDTNKLAAEIQERYPELGDVSIILPLAGRRPVVQVRPSKPMLVLSTFSGEFVVDENGRAIADVRNVESSVRDQLTVVQDESGLTIERGNFAMPNESVAFIKEVSSQLNAAKLDIQAYLLPTVANELHVRLQDKPYYIKFDIRGESRVQAGTLIAVKEKLEADKKTPKEYIDVRVPGKAYYK